MRIGRQESLPLYVRPDQKAELKALAARLDRTQQELLREAIDMLLKRYARKEK